CNVIEADASQPDGGFRFASGVGNNYDRILAMQNRAGPSGVLTAQADVDAARKMRGGKFLRITRVQDLRASGLELQEAIEFERLQLALQRFIERRTLFAVQHGVVDKIGRSLGLVSGNQLYEGVFAHGLKGVVQAALLTQRRNSFLAD